MADPQDYASPQFDDEGRMNVNGSPGAVINPWDTNTHEYELKSDALQGDFQWKNRKEIFQSYSDQSKDSYTNFAQENQFNALMEGTYKGTGREGGHVMAGMYMDENWKDIDKPDFWEVVSGLEEDLRGDAWSIMKGARYSAFQPEVDGGPMGTSNIQGKAYTDLRNLVYTDHWLKGKRAKPKGESYRGGDAKDIRRASDRFIDSVSEEY